MYLVFNSSSARTGEWQNGLFAQYHKCETLEEASEYVQKHGGFVVKVLDIKHSDE